jgi:glycine hydroxymethyltransferase
MMSSLLDLAVFSWKPRRPIKYHRRKSSCFCEALKDEFFTYALQLQKMQRYGRSFVKRGYHIISGGTDNHMMLIDLRNKGISGKDAENALVKAEITVNKNMVPFDDKSPFVTSEYVEPALLPVVFEADMDAVVALIDKVIMNHTNEDIIEEVANQVNEMMSERAFSFSK